MSTEEKTAPAPGAVDAEIAARIARQLRYDPARAVGIAFSGDGTGSAAVGESVRGKDVLVVLTGPPDDAAHWALELLTLYGRCVRYCARTMNLVGPVPGQADYVPLTFRFKRHLYRSVGGGCGYILNTDMRSHRSQSGHRVPNEGPCRFRWVHREVRSGNCVVLRREPFPAVYPGPTVPKMPERQGSPEPKRTGSAVVEGIRAAFCLGKKPPLSGGGSEKSLDEKMPPDDDDDERDATDDYDFSQNKIAIIADDRADGGEMCVKAERLLREDSTREVFIIATRKILSAGTFEVTNRSGVPISTSVSKSPFDDPPSEKCLSKLGKLNVPKVLDEAIRMSRDGR